MGSQTFSCQEHLGADTRYRPWIPTSDIFCGLMGFCTHCPHPATGGQIRSREPAIQDQHHQMYTSCKNVQLQTNHDLQDKLNYFSDFRGPLLSPSVPHKRPGASVWETV